MHHGPQSSKGEIEIVWESMYVNLLVCKAVVVEKKVEGVEEDRL